jgi:S-disulfanyl-L-cysteine oxidoreductase SoxD
MDLSQRVFAVVFASGVVGTIAALQGNLSALVTPAPQSPSLRAGAFTAAQQERGAAIYNRECSTCHGETLKGGEGSPPLVGPTFTTNYKGQTVADLFTRIRETMPAPPEQPGKLTAQEYADVVAHILSANGFPPGTVELSSDVEQLKRLAIELGQ